MKKKKLSEVSRKPSAKGKTGAKAASGARRPVPKVKHKIKSARKMATLAKKTAAEINRRAARMTPKARAKADAATKKIAGKVRARARKPAAGIAPSDLGLATPKNPVAIDAGKRKRASGGDSDRGFYLRLGDEKTGPANKAKVAEAAATAGAGGTKVSMNAYAAAATLYCIEHGIALFPAAKEEVAQTA